MNMMKELLLAFVVLTSCAILVQSLKCYSCSGDRDHCKDSNGTVCSDGQNKCSNRTVKKDGKDDFDYGCASDEDCDVLEKSCSDKKFKNSGTVCPSSCCASDLCNKPELQESTFKCFQCESGKSMDDCDLSGKPMQCSEDEKMCATITTEIAVDDLIVKNYRKGCRKQEECNKDSDPQLRACKEDDKCAIDCCAEGLCNAGTLSSVNGLALSACAFVATLLRLA